ncbi:MAG: hypothetical protein OEZ11_08985 [Gammaproteobacteria bacterium]|nr:hypothetical protein [Gammaproteobacteria bacterium]
MKKSDEQLAQEAKALFDASVDELDAATLSRLNRSRHRALEAAHSPRSALLRFAPAAGVAAAVLIAVMVALPGPRQVEVMPAAVADLDILLGEDSIEMLEELEFYSWLDVIDEGDDVG